MPFSLVAHADDKSRELNLFVYGVNLDEVVLYKVSRTPIVSAHFL